ncbi:MAG TPA: nuclear transport factor 2 family protein [Acidimicrobiales bacterium]|nr:nuclear transport factor 2 family protein [Acidimicrobiales bacterium]
MRTYTQNEMADFVAIQRLQASYADIVTRRAWVELKQIFLPDITLQIDKRDGAPLLFRTPEAIGDFIRTSIEQFDFFEFVILNSVVDLGSPDPARATARMYMVELRQSRDSGRRSNAFGLYRDTFVKQDEEWWFEARGYRSAARTAARELDAFGFGVDD